MKDIQAFIFDLDGVLVDTARYHFLAWRKLAQKLGLDLTKEENEKLKGVSRMESLETILKMGKIELSTHHKEILAEQKNGWYRAYIDDMEPDELFPGVLSFLQESRKLGLKLAVGSGSKNAMVVLERLKIEHLFDVICDGNDISNSKPHPEIFTLCNSRLQIEPTHAIVFEDAQTGIEAAHNAGNMAIGIGKKENLREADLVFAGLHEISPQDLIKKLVNLKDEI
jgi:beta-phosphoglucomutase